MAKFDFKKILEWLAFILRCPVCGQRYNLEQTKIVENKDDRSIGGGNLLVHTDCDRCKSSVVFGIAIDGPEIFSIGMVTDLTSSDSNKFKNSNPITPDEVLATHQFLTSFDGDFKRALK